MRLSTTKENPRGLSWTKVEDNAAITEIDAEIKKIMDNQLFQVTEHYFVIKWGKESK